MPISKINPDGTVRIYNSKTNEQRDVKPEDLSKYNPALENDYNVLQSLKSGNTNVTGLPADKQLQFTGALQGSGIVPPKGVSSATDQKNQQAFSATQNFINNLEQHYQEAEGGDTNLGPLTRILGIGKDIKGALGLNKDVNVYNREKAGFAATLKTLTGDTGVLTEQDYKRLASLLPDFKSTSKEAPDLFNDLRTQVAAKFGGKPEQTTFKPQEKNILQALFPETSKALTTGPEDLRQKMAARQAGLPDSRGNLGQSLSNTAKTLPGDLLDLLGIAAPAAGEIVGDLGAISGGKALVSGAKSLPGMLFPSGAAKVTRTGLIEGANAAGRSVDGTKIADHFTSWAERAIRGNPGKEKQIERVVDSVTKNFNGKEITPEEAMKIWLDADNGFNAQGVQKTALESKIDVQMREVLRPLLEDVAPGFDKATKAIATGMRNKNVANWIAKGAGGAAVGGISYALLGKLLGQNQNQ